MAGPADPHSQTEVAPLEGPAGERVTSAQDGAELVAGRYELLGMLGAGAMGTVYRARDRELDEVVALKVLKKELAASPGMLERFKREVKLARRVTHKNVARTFDIGEHAGDRFLTMEFIEGEMLGARVARLGRLAPAEAIAIARDVCDGLSVAHAAGVVHRDLKPENVILARAGHAVITDFGIARALVDGEMKKTGGLLVGTPAYMAPEQVEGRADLDARADLYALGAMLFELLTGAPPWTGDSVIAIAAARLLRPPPDPRTKAPDLPANLADVVMKLLARSRDDRYASADDAGRAMTALGTLAERPSARPPATRAAVPTGPLTRSVAVLPLLNLGAADDAYMGVALTEDLVDLLSVVPELRVRPRGDTARFDGPQRDVREIGRSLGVDVVVDGSVRRVGDDVRVAVRLVTVADGFQLWAKRFDRKAGDVLGVADAACAAIARALTTREVATARMASVDPEAQELYMRARYLLQRAWYETSRDAVELLREARQRAPGDARIAGTLALALARSFGMDGPGPEAGREARSVAEDALRLDPQQGEAHVARGILHLFHGEVAASLIQVREALERAPNNVDALDMMGRLLIELGRMDEGIAMLTRALAIEPGMAGLKNHRARAYALRRDWDAADEELATPPSHPGDLAPYLIMKARLLLWRDAKPEAEALAHQYLTTTLSPFGRGAVQGLLRIASTTVMSEQDLIDIERLLPIDKNQSARRAAFNAQTRAEMLLACKRYDEALDVLAIADANGFFDLAWLENIVLLDGQREKDAYRRVHASVSVRASRALDVIDR